MSEEPDGHYYAKGNRIFRAPVRTPKEGGGSTISIGFPVCDVSEFVGQDGVESIVAAFNKCLRG